MQAFVGANLDQMISLYQALQREAGDVERLTGALDTTLNSTTWTGAVAEQFRQRWADEFRPALTNLQQALEQAQMVVMSRKEAIDQATNVYGG